MSVKMPSYHKRGKSVPLGALLIGAGFIFIILMLLLIQSLPFALSQNEQVIVYGTAMLAMGGMLVMLMRNAL
jgi:hypothetical protein